MASDITGVGGSFDGAINGATEYIITDKQNIVSIADALRDKIDSTEKMSFEDISSVILDMSKAEGGSILPLAYEDELIIPAGSYVKNDCVILALPNAEEVKF